MDIGTIVARVGLGILWCLGCVALVIMCLIELWALVIAIPIFFLWTGFIGLAIRG